MRSSSSPEQSSQVDSLASDGSATSTALDTPPQEETLTARRSANWEHVCADDELVRRCIRGEVGAWEELYAQCHPPLLVSIEYLLGHRGADRELVDELAARVWYALIDKDGKRLAKFDRNKRARLSTFLQLIAQDVTKRHFRAERRRRRREGAAARPAIAEIRDTPDHLEIEEFRETLTQGEQSYLEESLHGDKPVDPQRSRAMAWKHASQIRKKLRRFFLG